jgi:pimeloyl-ACP methyl ester carboxylesterase
MTLVRRGFVDLPSAQIHYRHAGVPGARRPLVMIHASPASAKTLEPLIAALAADRRVVAPDTLGNGDSAGSIPDGADVGFFAATCAAAIDALGIAEFDLYGTHTGASIAAEIAIAQPRRVRNLILDGIGLYDEALQRELLERYAPPVRLDRQGMYLAWIWHFVRDTYMFWPWYRLDREHRRDVGLPEPRVLHEKVLEVMKAAETYHHSYRAAISNDKRARLPLLRVRTLVACARSDMLLPWRDEVASLVPGSEKALTDGVADAAAAFRRFLDAGSVDRRA